MLGLRFALGWVHVATGQRGQAGCRGRGCVPHSPGWVLPPVLHEAGEALAGGRPGPPAALSHAASQGSSANECSRDVYVPQAGSMARSPAPSTGTGSAA